MDSAHQSPFTNISFCNNRLRPIAASAAARAAMLASRVIAQAFANWKTAYSQCRQPSLAKAICDSIQSLEIS